MIWYVHTFLWGRYAGSTETVLNQDLALIEEIDGGLDRLIKGLRRDRGDLTVQPNDFIGWSKGTCFYPLLYMLTRVWHAKDWDTGVELSSHLLGHLSRLELHHIFPKQRLYDHGYSRPDVNALANFAFLTQETNLLVSALEPREYLPEFASKNPGALESHWIPMDEGLWKIENYLTFLEARRRLLAQAANEFLSRLHQGHLPERAPAPTIFERSTQAAPGGIRGEEEERIILECSQWASEHGLPKGELLYELVDPQSGKLVAVLDLAWPDGLQPGFSQPVALLIGEEHETEDTVTRAGYRVFTDADSFRAYVTDEILALGTEAA